MKYLKKHRYQNQKNVIDGIPIDPILRDEFDVTDNDERPQMEINDWWGKAYIRTDTWGDNEESYEEYFARLQQFNSERKARDMSLIQLETKEEFTARVQRQKESWFNEFPSGTRYMVRCLDGGAWDRSTNKGSYPFLEEALQVAKNSSF